MLPGNRLEHVWERLKQWLHRGTWNWVALVLILVSLLLVATTMLSIDTTARSTADRLSLTSARNTLQPIRTDQPGRLQRAAAADARELQADRESLKQTAMQMAVGVYAMNNYGLDLKVPSFQSTGYIWFKWNQAMQDYFQQRDLKVWRVIAPINLLSIPNGAGTVFQPIGEDKPVLMADGNYYQLVAYKGEFYIDRGDFSRHPFPEVSLPMILEADDINLDFRDFRMRPDLQGSGVGEFISTNSSWLATGWSMAEYRHHYATDFGFDSSASDYSQLIFDVNYRTSAWTSFWKLLAPLLIVMAMVVASTKLESSLWEVRLTLPVTVLLTLVFLQQSSNAELPDLPYLTFIDEVFVVAYLLTLGSFGLMLWGCRRYFKAMQIESEAERKEALRRLDLSDDAWPSAVILVGMVAVAACWFIR
ncbi:MAG: hypothetical protein VKM34_01970 [Cyanobacteriota bacterium]|nr:hypothetical protein [Cyanobacteriota bacterium]